MTRPEVLLAAPSAEGLLERWVLWEPLGALGMDRWSEGKVKHQQTAPF